MRQSAIAERTVRASTSGYTVTEDGRVLSPSNEPIRLTQNPQGYLKFSVPKVTAAGSARTVYVHQLAALQRFGPRALSVGTQVRHRNGVKTDNTRSNILIGTGSDNQLDIPIETRLRMMKVRVRAAAQHNRLFSADALRAIRESPKGIRELARELGVAPSTILYAKRGDTYRDI